MAVVNDHEDQTLTKVSEILGKTPTPLEEVSEIADTQLITKVSMIALCVVDISVLLVTQLITKLI